MLSLIPVLINFPEDVDSISFLKWQLPGRDTFKCFIFFFPWCTAVILQMSILTGSAFGWLMYFQYWKKICWAQLAKDAPWKIFRIHLKHYHFRNDWKRAKINIMSDLNHRQINMRFKGGDRRLLFSLWFSGEELWCLK